MNFISAKRVLTKVKYNNWFGIDYNMNLYRGCNHGCIYCDSRSRCYHIDNFDKVSIKENVIEIFNKEISSKGKKGVISLGSMSDTYNHLEKQLELTKKTLEIIKKKGFGVSISTKSDLIIRDIELIKEINENYPSIIQITITTTNDELSKKIEPNAPVSSLRFEALRKLNKEGIFAGVLMTPVLPYITDTKENIREMVKKVHEAGGKFIFTYMSVTLRDNQREYYYKKLDELFYGLKKKYMVDYGNNYNCMVKNEELYNFFKQECKKYGIIYNMNEIINRYKKSIIKKQLSLF